MHRQASLRTARSPPRTQTGSERPARRPPIAARGAALTAFWLRIHRRAWMTEEAACAFRDRSLLQDNPASG
jgi:hypothetical protein